MSEQLAWIAYETLPWCDPLSMPARRQTQDDALLYSGLQEQDSGRYSYYFAEPIAIAQGATLAAIPPVCTGGEPIYDWVGYIGYEASNVSAQSAEPGESRFPGLRFVRYRHAWRFDHLSRRIDCFTRAGDGSARLTLGPPQPAPAARPAVTSLRSNFKRAQYEQSVRTTREAIAQGEFYQANLTRKFTGTLAQAPDAPALFQALCAASPAPFSAMIRHGGQTILSLSPESFLQLEAGVISTRPIKGTMARGADAAADAAQQSALRASAKDQAEHLMIVDLMRNDLARICAPGSVSVAALAALHSYATLHHLISTVRGKLQPQVSLRDILAATLPPGSMTGAPKQAVIAWCANEERAPRGVYSGVLGGLGPGLRADLSVVIRTLLITGTQFEFQVGGGIVADSTPEGEWRETLLKARAIASILGISESDLAAL